MTTMTVAPSKSELAYSHIKDRITRREYTPGYRLVLSVLAAELDVSVVPVREAVRQLEAEGLVTFERNVGARVAMIDDAAYQDAMAALAILEGAATALAAPLVSPAQLARARELNEQMTALMADGFDARAFTQLNRQFHETLCGPCPNTRLWDLVENEWDRLEHLRESTFSFVPARARRSVVEHARILALIEEGASVSRIETAARTHRLSTLDAYRESRNG